jgi:hypothetical protein
MYVQPVVHIQPIRQFYWAHSKRIYRTQAERILREYLEKRFQNHKLVCPNRDLGELGSIQKYLDIIDTCEFVVATEYCGYLGRGVFTEVQYSLESNKPTLLINNNFKMIRIKSIELYDPNDWVLKYGQIKETTRFNSLSALGISHGSLD